MRPIAIKLVLFAALASSLIVSIRHAAALTYDDIKGKWCSPTATITFTANQLIVTFNNRSPTRRFTITKYEFTNDVIIMHWVDDNKDVYTRYGSFRAKERQMSQLADPKDCDSSTGCPRRELRRC